MNNELEVPVKASKTVTASRTIDFPSLGWGINEGDTRELPADPEAQKAILANPFIKLTK